jgi:hypothetical protein
MRLIVETQDALIVSCPTQGQKSRSGKASAGFGHSEVGRPEAHFPFLIQATSGWPNHNEAAGAGGRFASSLGQVFSA